MFLILNKDFWHVKMAVLAHSIDYCSCDKMAIIDCSVAWFQLWKGMKAMKKKDNAEKEERQAVWAIRERAHLIIVVGSSRFWSQN